MKQTDKYLNRELSWLEFNYRVLEEALDATNPLLERLKFISIFSSNLDEFFMVRVAGLKKMESESISESESPDILPVHQIRNKIESRVKEMIRIKYGCLQNDILKQLTQYDIVIKSVGDLNSGEKYFIEKYFKERIFPVLTPLSFDPAHPFPFLTNRSSFLVFFPKIMGMESHGSVEIKRLCFVEVPSVLPRFVQLGVSENSPRFHYIALEDIITEYLPQIFYGIEKPTTYSIRILRNLDYTLLENKVVDLLRSMQRELINREHQEVVRLEYSQDMPKDMLDILRAKLNLEVMDLYSIPGIINPASFFEITKIPIEVLHDPPFNPRLPKIFGGHEDIFSLISKEDILVHHPYESFYTVTELLYTAAMDENVLAIKQMLYRTAGDSPIIDSLIRAAENGKKVTAVVELKARFDETNNMVWAKKLQDSGVNVVFGFVGYKTHSKATLIVRKEGNEVKQYVHLSTGNYNSTTAKLYTDLGLFTSHPDIVHDVTVLFNLVTGVNVLSLGNPALKKETLPDLRIVAVAPYNLRSTFKKLIEREIHNAKKLGKGMIIAKMNALVDKEIIDKLYEASQAGVKIHLIIRGICCLRPKVPGLSENIEVTSIVDRFLEHSRIYYFQNGEHDDEIYLGSADWMPRNMDRRIEILFPVLSQNLKKRIINEILNICLEDNVKARVLQSDGSYIKRKPESGKIAVRSQYEFIDLVREEGLKSMPYDQAIRYEPQPKKGGRPIAKRWGKKK